jgi:ribosome-binding factor A
MERVAKGRPDRLRRVASLVQQTVAAQLLTRLSRAEAVTVTIVDVSPDLRHAVVWLGVTGADGKEILTEINSLRPELQRSLGEVMTTKFVPRMEFRLDQSGLYADHIGKLLRGL